MSDDKKKPTGNEADKYESGRKGNNDTLGTDSDSEAEARERGKEDRANAKETQKEKEKEDETTN